MSETIGEHIDRISPEKCIICGTSISIVKEWPICPNSQCRMNQTDEEAYIIRKYRSRDRNGGK